MKVALVHDYLKEYGGAERVVEALHEIFPEAPLYTAYKDLEAMGEAGKRFKSWDIRTSWLQKVPLANNLISPFRIFAPMMFESFDFSEYDLVISSCAIYFSKAVITKPESLHISYIHTPPRYLYGYTTSFNYKKNPITRILGELANHYLRIYDFETSQRPDILVANSKNIQKRIEKFYRRDSVVIYPPATLRVARRAGSPVESKYFLSVSRLVRGKGIEIIIEACAKLGLQLKVVGAGPELENLKRLLRRIAPRNDIQFLGRVEDEKLPELYSNAKALIVASEDEDFGITAVEAQVAGTPVIAPASGGFLETVIDGPPSHEASARRGKTGLLYGGPGMVTVDSLTEALSKFKSSDYNPEILRKNAEKFSKERFKKEIMELVEKNLKNG